MKLNSHIHRLVVTALGILSLGPALVFAGSSPKPVEERGVIKSVDVDAHMLVVAEHRKNTEQKFQWNDQTKFSERSKSVTASALKEGEHVHLNYVPSSDTPILQSVHITPAKPEKHGANTISPASANRA